MSLREPSRRLFFALWPTAEQQAAMGEAARELVLGSGARGVPDSNLHVTLAFLGSVPEPRISDLAAIARRVADSGVAAQPLRVSFDHVEYWKKAQVFCAVPSDARTAHDAGSLAAALQADLLAAGFAPDLKPFRAHVTLARKVPRRSDWKLYLHPVSWRFTGFGLIESRTTAEGALYSVVESWLLARAPSKANRAKKP